MPQLPQYLINNPQFGKPFFPKDVANFYVERAGPEDAAEILSIAAQPAAGALSRETADARSIHRIERVGRWGFRRGLCRRRGRWRCPCCRFGRGRHGRADVALVALGESARLQKEPVSSRVVAVHLDDRICHVVDREPEKVGDAP